jgi:hypothetical protein
MTNKLKKMVEIAAISRAEHYWGERSELEQEEQNSFDNDVSMFKDGATWATSHTRKEVIEIFRGLYKHYWADRLEAKFKEMDEK